MNALTFLKEIRRELTKVTWPTREELIKMTTLVIIVSFVVGAYIGAIDFGLSKLLSQFLK